MKLCDRCYLIGEFKPGPCVVTIGVEDYDLCQSCEDEIRDIIIKPKPKKATRGRPKRAAKQKPITKDE